MKKALSLLYLTIFLFTACQSVNHPFTIYGIGDSTMTNKKAEVYPETGWGQVLHEFFDESVTISNHAVNGRSTKSFIDQEKWQAVLDSLKPGDYVFIQFGHNDQKDQDSTRYTTPFGTYSDNLEKFVIESREKGATPILFTSLVRRKFGDDRKLTDTHGAYPVATRNVAQKLDVPLIDLQKLTENWANSLGDEASKKMYLWTDASEKYPEGRKDDTHLSVEGAKEVALLALNDCKKQKLKFSKNIK